jgi:hypothetical protein
MNGQLVESTPSHSPLPQEREDRVDGRRLDRLKRLLEHMENGTLSVDHFFFGVFRDRPPLRNPAAPICGTIGCMGGELPGLWPDDWKWSYEGPPRTISTAEGWCAPRLKCARMGQSTFREDAAEFFGISFEEVGQLFYPGPLGSGLDEHATREAVTEKLREFIAKQVESFQGMQEVRDRMREARAQTERTVQALRQGPAEESKRLHGGIEHSAFGMDHQKE